MKGLNRLANLKPCMRCERELPLSAFDSPDSMFCKECTEEIVDIIKNKYNAIEAALFRAKLRKQSKGVIEELRRKLS
jgi:hypothetical protein